MTEKEFLDKREPFWLEGEDLKIIMPSGPDKNDIHAYLCKKYSYNWLFAIRGYWMPDEKFVMLYTGDYETPNCTVMVAQYLLNYFKADWIGFGCNKGKPGEVWEPKIKIYKV